MQRRQSGVGHRGRLTQPAAGNLTHRLADSFPRDYDALRAGFNAALDTRQATMRSVVGSAHSIRSGTGEISQAATIRRFQVGAAGAGKVTSIGRGQAPAPTQRIKAASARLPSVGALAEQSEPAEEGWEEF